MDEQYPSAEDLKKITEWPYTDGYEKLFEFIASIWSYYEIVPSEVKIDSLDREYVEYKLVTCGWSGNEDIIRAMNKNIMLGMICWESSHRGGLHIYRLTKKGII